MATKEQTTECSLGQEMTAKADELKKQRERILKNGLNYALKNIYGSIRSQKNTIDELIKKGKGKEILDFAADTILKATNGNMKVPHYSSSLDKTSPVLVYTGMHWEEIPKEQLFFDFIRGACKKIGVSGAYVNDPGFFKNMKKRVELMLSHTMEQKEKEDVVWVNFANGTLEIKRNGRRRFRPHCREDYFRYVLPYNYDKQAQCPRFLQFLDEVLPDSSTHTTILEFIAYCLVPWLKLEKILALLGTGSNGKSVLLDVIKQLFGMYNVAYESLADLTTNECHRANIEGRLVNVSTENEGHINSAIFKTLASGEPCSCRLYYSQPYTMTRYAKLLFAFNDMPRINSGYGSMRRWLLIKFNVRITEEQADTELNDKLAEELPGIMNLVLDVLPGLLERKKFSKSEAVEKANKELEFRNNPVQQFVMNRCKVSERLTKGSELYKDFKEFCDQNNYRKLSNQSFYERLEELGNLPQQDGHQKAFYLKVVKYED